MNQKNTKNTPKLRFPEFSGEWEEKIFTDLYRFGSTNSLSRDKLSDDPGDIYNIHYGDVHTKYKSGFRFANEKVPSILEGIDGKDLLSQGDIVVADASEDYKDIGKTIEILDTNNKKIVSGLHTILGKKVSKEVVTGFMQYLMQSESQKLKIKRIAQGVKVLGLPKEYFKNLSMILTEKNEQIKIASFLSKVDEWIENLKKQKENLEKYKKGMMQKIFSQEIRFKDENGKPFPEWEEKRAGEIFENITNKNHNGDLPLLAVTQENGVILRDDLDLKINSSKTGIKGYKIIEPGNFVISLRSFQGGIEYSSIKGISSPAYTVLRSVLPIVDYFYKIYFKKDSFIKQLDSMIYGIRDGKQISYSEFRTMKIPYPIQKEQQKIAEFLTSLDNLIESKQKEIELAEAWKKGLMQRMFV